MNRFKRIRQSTLVAATALCVAAGGAATVTGQTASSVSGQAFGISVTTPLVALAPAPLATLGAAGGTSNLSTGAITVAGVLTAQDLTASATGVVGENASSAQSLVRASDVNILNGIVRASQVIAVASSASNGQQASSNGGGSTIVDLVVNGVPMGVVSPRPNTTIELSGVGTIILNEQVVRGGGITDRGMDVTMIHVILKNALTGARTGEIIVGRASSYAKFVR